MDLNFYTEFENNFRGTREQISKVLSSYDGLIEYIKKIDNYPSLLDIGSGRGEWIQKCNSNGFKSIGLELDSQMAKYCRKFDLNIKEGDALSLLDEFDDDSFSIVSAFHVIEHLSHENIKKLLSKSKRVLKPHGLLILETPSIDSLVVSTKSFYIDPTHINPIHPDLLVFMLKRIGYKEYKHYFINGGPLKNSDFEKLTRVLNGVAQDVVFIASKNNFKLDEVNVEKELIEKHMSIAKTTLELAIQFDESRIERYEKYDNEIYMMRKKIQNLERFLQNIEKQLVESNTSNQRDSLLFLKNTYSGIKRIIRSNITILKKIIKSFLLILIETKFYKIYRRNIHKLPFIYLLVMYYEKRLDRYGYRIFQNKIVRKSMKSKEDIHLICKCDEDLEYFFYKSDNAKKVFNDLNKNF